MSNRPLDWFVWTKMKKWRENWENEKPEASEVAVEFGRPSHPRFHRLLLGFTGFFWLFDGFTCFFPVFTSFTGFYLVLLGFTGFYRVLLGFTGFYCVFNWVLLGFTGFCNYFFLQSLFRVLLQRLAPIEDDEDELLVDGVSFVSVAVWRPSRFLFGVIFFVSFFYTICFYIRSLGFALTN